MTEYQTALDDRVVIVTGAARGLGRAMVEGLLQFGGRVAGFDLGGGELANLDRWATERFGDTRWIAGRGDVTNPAECVAMVATTCAHFGTLDCLVNNAGRIPPKLQNFFELDVEIWRQVMDVNVNGAFNMAHAAYPVLSAKGQGRIINILTNRIVFTNATLSPYGPSKAALESATAIWAKELEGTGITVNGLLPGGTAATRMAGDRRDGLLRPDVMVKPVVWLCSDKSGRATGMRYVANEWDAEHPTGRRSAGRRLSAYVATTFDEYTTGTIYNHETGGDFNEFKLESDNCQEHKIECL